MSSDSGCSNLLCRGCECVTMHPLLRALRGGSHTRAGNRATSHRRLFHDRPISLAVGLVSLTRVDAEQHRRLRPGKPALPPLQAQLVSIWPCVRSEFSVKHRGYHEHHANTLRHAHARAHTHTRTHAQTYTHTHARTRARAHTYTRARARAHTHCKCERPAGETLPPSERVLHFEGRAWPSKNP